MSYISDFSVFLKEIKKCSLNTYQSYIRDVNRFASFFKGNNSKNINDINKDDIINYISFLKTEHISDSSLKRVLASLRCFFSYLQGKDVVSDNPVSDVKIKNNEKKLPEVLTQQEVMLLLSQPNGNDFKSYRDKAMLELMYATGIKVSEITALTLYDINLSVGILHIHDNKHERIIPIYPDALKSITYYINNVRPSVVLNSDEIRLFTNMSGQPLSRQGFWKIVKSYAEKAKITKEINPLTFRHSFATHLLENGAELKDIQHMLGHSDISTTNIYAELVKNKYTLSYKKFHPLAK